MSVTEGRRAWPVGVGPVVVALGEGDDPAGIAELAVVAARERGTRLSVVAIATPAPLGVAVCPQALPVTVASLRAGGIDRMDRRLARLRTAVPAEIALDHHVACGLPGRVLARVLDRAMPSAIVLGALLDQRGVAGVVARARRVGMDVHLVARREVAASAGCRTEPALVTR